MCLPGTCHSDIRHGGPNTISSPEGTCDEIVSTLTLNRPTDHQNITWPKNANVLACKYGMGQSRINIHQ